MVHIVAYDLKAPNDTKEDYERVIGGLKEKYSYWCHLEKSVWLISTTLNAGEVRDSLRQFLYDTDVLFVSRLQGNWASFNIGAKRAEWLKGVNFNG